MCGIWCCSEPLARLLPHPTSIGLPSACDPRACAQDPPIREIFVPFEDLNIILENDNQRVFLSRKEYDELVAKAVSKPDVKAPHSAAVLAANV